MFLDICGVPNFWEHLFFSLFFHDFGKAATGFQEYLKGGTRWHYRHEILSSSFIHSLNGFYSEDRNQAIGLCIITHHKDINSLHDYNPDKSKENKNSFDEKLNELKPNFNELMGYFDFIPGFQ